MAKLELQWQYVERILPSCLKFILRQVWKKIVSKKHIFLSNGNTFYNLLSYFSGSSFGPGSAHTGAIDWPEVHPILFPKFPAFRQRTFCQILWSYLHLTAKESLAYMLVDKAFSPLSRVGLLGFKSLCNASTFSVPKDIMCCMYIRFVACSLVEY